MSEWILFQDRRPPKKKRLLMATKTGTIFVGMERYGNLGEPDHDVFAYRDQNGHWVSEIKCWAEIPELPKDKK